MLSESAPVRRMWSMASATVMVCLRSVNSAVMMLPTEFSG